MAANDPMPDTGWPPQFLQAQLQYSRCECHACTQARAYERQVGRYQPVTITWRTVEPINVTTGHQLIAAIK